MLLLMRHGPAEETSSTGRDYDRVLTPPGIKVVRGVLERLSARKERPTRIVSSPFARAKETALLAGETFGLRVENDPALGADVDPSAVLRRLLDESGVIMAVGHDPYFSHAASHFAGENVMMDKGMIVAFEKRGGAVHELFRIASR